MENERKKGYNKKTKYRVCTFLISLIFACTIWTGRVMARDLINLNQRHTLTVEYPCADTSFQIYKVAVYPKRKLYVDRNICKISGRFRKYGSDTMAYARINIGRLPNER